MNINLIARNTRTFMHTSTNIIPHTELSHTYVHTRTHTEPAVLAKLEKLCRARGLPWTVAHYHTKELEAVAAVAAEAATAAGEAKRVTAVAVKEEVSDELCVANCHCCGLCEEGSAM